MQLDIWATGECMSVNFESTIFFLATITIRSGGSRGHTNDSVQVSFGYLRDYKSFWEYKDQLLINKKTCLLDKTGLPAAQQRDSSRLENKVTFVNFIKEIVILWSIQD